MPKGTRVYDCVQDVKAKGGGNPYAICQASTGQSYHTGKSLKKKSKPAVKRMRAMGRIAHKRASTYV